MFMQAPYGILIVDRNGHIRDMNAAACKILGLSGHARQNFYLHIPEESREQTIDMYHHIFDSKTGFREIRQNVLTAAGLSPLLITARYVEMGRYGYLSVILIDLTAKNEEQAKSFQFAYEDMLTGLYNRAFFHSIVDRFTSARSPDQPFALMVMDMDRFKLVNDTMGQKAGDEFLKEISFRLRIHGENDDIIARLSGDEFALLIPQYDDEEHLFHKAQALLETIHTPYSYQGEEIYCTASIGISLYPYDSIMPEQLLAYADLALQQAKLAGKNTFSLYSAERSSHLTKFVNKEKSLRKAVERGELALYYQPQINIKTGEVVGAEALLRWFSPEWGAVSPEEFIPMAEESGLILGIGEWVLEQACLQVKAWSEAGLLHSPISINISGKQLYSDTFADTVHSILNQTGVNPALLGFEITETTAIRNIEQVYTMLVGFAKMGICLSIDDFGLGYSSLAMLRQLPVHVVKIDKSFVSDLSDDGESQAIIEAIIAMSRSLKLTVVAEGMESQKQWEQLKLLQCDTAQGYSIGKPMPAAEFEAQFLTRRYAFNPYAAEAGETSESKAAQA